MKNTAPLCRFRHPDAQVDLAGKAGVDQRVRNASVRFLRRLTDAETIAEHATNRPLNDPHEFVRGSRLIGPSNRDQIDVAFQAAMHRDGVAVEPRHLADRRQDGIEDRTAERTSSFPDCRVFVLRHHGHLKTIALETERRGCQFSA